MEQIIRKPPQNELDPDDQLLRASEVMRYLNVSRASAYRLMTDGTLRAYRLYTKHGGRAMVRVSLKELLAWREAHRQMLQTA